MNLKSHRKENIMGNQYYHNKISSISTVTKLLIISLNSFDWFNLTEKSFYFFLMLLSFQSCGSLTDNQSPKNLLNYILPRPKSETVLGPGSTTINTVALSWHKDLIRTLGLLINDKAQLNL